MPPLQGHMGRPLTLTRPHNLFRFSELGRVNESLHVSLHLDVHACCFNGGRMSFPNAFLCYPRAKGRKHNWFLKSTTEMYCTCFLETFLTI